VILSQLVNGSTDLRALALELDVPVVAGLQHQGDVSVVPVRMAGNYVKPRRPVPAAGVPVMPGRSNGNTHLLLAAGDVLFEHWRASASGISHSRLTLGCLFVGEGAEAYLDHLEHGNSGIAPGRYVLRRKREMAGEQRLVAD
jgi:hypothetical protein